MIMKARDPLERNLWQVTVDTTAGFLRTGRSTRPVAVEADLFVTGHVARHGFVGIVTSGASHGSARFGEAPALQEASRLETRQDQ